MTPLVLLRLAWREGRGARGRLLLLVLGIAVGVSAVVAVAGLGGGLREAMFRESRRLLAADVVVSAREHLPERLDQALAREGPLARTLVYELPTVVAAGGGRADPAPSRLVELKVVEATYPLRGELVVEPARPLGELLADGGAIIARDLASALDLSLGSTLEIGAARAVVRAFVVSEPDRAQFAFSVGPRVFIGHETFDASGLDQFGARLERRVLLALDDTADAEEARALAQRLRRAVQDEGQTRVLNWADAQPAVQRGIARVESFLALAALLALVLGSLAAALAARSWLESRLDALALQKCLGMERRHVLVSAAGQLVVLALIGAAAGCALGVLGVHGAITAYRDLLPEGLSVPALRTRPLVLGAGLGIASALVASLGPLLAATRVPPILALRRQAAPLRSPRIATLGAAAVAIAALVGAAWMQSSMELALLFTAGLLAAAFGLFVAARLVLSTARRVPRAWLPRPVRWGLSSLTRPANPALGALLALGIGVFAVATVHLVEQRLAHELANAMPPDAPTAFFLDVQSDQWPHFERRLAELGADDARSAPMVVGRLRRIDGREVRDLLDERRATGTGGRWALRREQRMTFGPELPDGNTLLRGRLWSDPDRAEVSVEEEFARDLGVDVGSTIVVDVQGVPIELLVSSIRAVRWESFRINFFLYVEPGPLDDAPQVRIATARLPTGREQQVQDALRADFPNVTLIDIGDIRRKLTTLFGRVSAGVRFLGAACLVAGALVLIAALAAAGRERRRDGALLRTLGASRLSALASLASEYALLGAVAGLVGGTAAMVLARTLLVRVLDVEALRAGGFEWGAPFTSAALVGGVAAIAGCFAAALAMRRPAREVLRAP